MALILLLMVLAKMCGESHMSGIAEWATLRAEILADLLQLKRKSLPHNSTDRRMLAAVVKVEEREQMSRVYLIGKKYFGKQGLMEIQGKVR